jgi:hypothetical protein
MLGKPFLGEELDGLPYPFRRFSGHVAPAGDDGVFPAGKAGDRHALGDMVEIGHVDADEACPNLFRDFGMVSVGAIEKAEND